MTNTQSGNAALDGSGTRGWIIGSFIPEGIRKTANVEIKWGMHAAGEARDDWVTGEERTTVCILVSGSFIMEFADQTAELNEPGDYVMWSAGVDHKWHAAEDSTVITVRWIESKQ